MIKPKLISVTKRFEKRIEDLAELILNSILLFKGLCATHVAIRIAVGFTYIESDL